MYSINSDPDARTRFEHFYSRHQPWVLALLIRLTRDSDRAADISQDLWLKIYSRWGEFEPRIEGTGVAWLRTIALHALYDDSRARGCRAATPIEAVELTDPRATPFETAADDEERRILYDLVASFHPPDRDLVDQIAGRQLSTRAAAEALDSTVPAVVTRWCRIRKQLRTLAKEKGLR